MGIVQKIVQDSWWWIAQGDMGTCELGHNQKRQDCENHCAQPLRELMISSLKETFLPLKNTIRKTSKTNSDVENIVGDTEHNKEKLHQYTLKQAHYGRTADASTSAVTCKPTARF